MIDELKYLIDESENNPKAKELLLKVAQLKEENQSCALELIKIMINTK